MRTKKDDFKRFVKVHSLELILLGTAITGGVIGYKMRGSIPKNSTRKLNPCEKDIAETINNFSDKAKNYGVDNRWYTTGICDLGIKLEDMGAIGESMIKNGASPTDEVNNFILFGTHD